MALQEKATASVELDGQQAENELKELKSRATELRKEMKQLKLDKDPQYAVKRREFDEISAKIKGANKSAFDLNTTLRNLSGSSMKDLTKAQTILNAQLRNNRRDTAAARQEFANKTKQLQAVRSELARVNTQVRGFNGNMSLSAKVSRGFRNGLAMVGIGLTSVVGIISGLRKSITTFNEFEESVANLGAITGLQGEQLEWMAERAKQTSVAVTDMGVRFQSSAKDIVDAYTMIGSKRPELLANREALASVTEEAMILSRAAKIELEPAAAALTTVMNQFNEPADQARRIINALGAGSKVGAANVEYLNSVIERSGTSARGAGLNVEQLIGTIEGIAPRFSEPAEAATALRNVFIRMQGLDDEINPAIVGWEQALENLAEQQLSTTEITQMFGIQSVNMIQALIDGREDIQNYTQAVTDSNVAIEQAAINSDTNAAKLEQARNKAALLRIELGEKLAPALIFSTNGFSFLLKAVKEVIDNWDKYRQILLLSLGILLAYRWELVKATAANIANNLTLTAGIGLRIKENALLAVTAVREAALTGWRVKGSVATKAATAAQRVFNLVVSQFPGFAIVAAITAIIGAIKLWDKNNAAARDRLQEHNRLLDENNKLMNNAEDEAQKVADSMQRLSTLTNQEKTALYELNRETIKKLQLDLEQMRINRVLAQQNAANVSAWQTTMAAVKSILPWIEMSNELTKASVNNMSEAGEEFNDMISQMEQSVNRIIGANSDLQNIMTAEARANQIMGDSITALEQKANLYSLALRNAVIGSEDYNRIQGLLRATQEQLNTAMSDGRQETNQAVNAYRQLTQAISDARTQMEHLVAVGDFDQAKAVNATVQALEGQKLVMDGIIEYGGDVNAFLDSLTDDTVAMMEEIDEANNNFLETWGESFDEIARRRQELQQQEIDSEMRILDFKLEKDSFLKDRRIQSAKETQKAIQQVTDAALAESFNLFSMYSYARQDREISDLQARKDRELSNENLTEEERLRIQEKYQREEAKIKEDAWKRQRNADLLQSVINGALAVTRALAAFPGFPYNAASVTAAAALAAIQTAAIAAQPVPQFASGRYATVMGQNDGRIYQAELAGRPRTGIYKRPALIAEQGPEMIIDAPTTRHLQLNYPEIIQGIMANRVPQYATGRYPAEASTGRRTVSGENTADINSVLEQIIATLEENAAAMHRSNLLNEQLLNQLSRGLAAEVSLFSLKKALDDTENLENLTKY